MLIYGGDGGKCMEEQNRPTILARTLEHMGLPYPDSMEVKEALFTFMKDIELEREDSSNEECVRMLEDFPYFIYTHQAFQIFTDLQLYRRFDFDHTLTDKNASSFILMVLSDFSLAFFNAYIEIEKKFWELFQ